MGLLCAQGQQRGDFCLAGLSFSCVHLIDFIFIAYLSIYFILGGDPKNCTLGKCMNVMFLFINSYGQGIMMLWLCIVGVYLEVNQFFCSSLNSSQQ